MNLMEQRKALLDACKDLAESAKSAGRELTRGELDGINQKLDQVKTLDDSIARAKEGVGVLERLGQLNTSERQALESLGLEKAPSLGEHFVKYAAARLKEVKGTRFSIGSPEYSKAVGDPIVTTGLTFPQIDTTVTQAYRRQAVVADLLGSGTMTSTSLTYYVEGPSSGGFAAVSELGKKPQISYEYSTVTETLTKIAGFIKMSDEMTEDLSFLVSEINGRLMYDLSIFEEWEILNGDGVAPNLSGILDRTGLLDEAAADGGDNADALFRGMTDVQIATGLACDGLVINPVDYQTIRLGKDQNGQYYAGGPFGGAYGNGNGVVFQPPVWGLRTVVTAAIDPGTAIVAAWAQGGTVYRKGGVRVESTNSDVDDFEYNRITIRAEERLALAVRKPSAFCVVTLSADPAAPLAIGATGPQGPAGPPGPEGPQGPPGTGA